MVQAYTKSEQKAIAYIKKFALGVDTFGRMRYTEFTESEIERRRKNHGYDVDSKSGKSE